MVIAGEQALPQTVEKDAADGRGRGGHRQILLQLIGEGAGLAALAVLCSV